MKKYAFGADIGGTTVKLGLFETTGNLLCSFFTLIGFKSFVTIP